jgi:hypothetical protein
VNLYFAQEKQKKDAEAAASGKAIKQTAGELRLQKGNLRTLNMISFKGWLGIFTFPFLKCNSAFISISRQFSISSLLI